MSDGMVTAEVWEAYSHIRAAVSARWAPMRGCDIYVSPRAYSELSGSLVRTWPLSPYEPVLHSDSWLTGTEMRAQVRL